jgi:hypothetical protein
MTLFRRNGKMKRLIVLRDGDLEGYGDMEGYAWKRNINHTGTAPQLSFKERITPGT